MTITLTEEVARNVIKKLINAEDYRIEVITLLNTEFLQYTVEFFKKIVTAKLKNEDITIDWYKKEFLNDNLSSEEIICNAGLNKKTISNMYNSARREIVIKASREHYDKLYNAIESLIESENEINVTLTLKFNAVSVDLNVTETLIVINSLAVKRSTIRGGLWSTAGKRVEKPLMETLCKLYGVKEENYKIEIKGKDKTKSPLDFVREIDFYLCNKENDFKCEVKLMGKGNPESADAVIARDSAVFVADKLSATNKKQLDSLKVQWVELRGDNGYKRFKKVLDNLNIPYKNFTGDLNEKLNLILDDILKNKTN